MSSDFDGRSEAHRSRTAARSLTHWELVNDPGMAGSGRERQGKLVNKPTVDPSVAILEIFEDVDKWAFDCAEFVQVAHLYARWKTMGDAAFDASTSGRVAIRIYYSTGIQSTLLYGRDHPGEPMYRIEAEGSFAEPTPIDDLLADAPTGSRVLWRNLAASPSSDFFNENTIKLGPDEYAAHGFGTKNRFTRADLERELATLTYRVEHGEHAEPPSAYIHENVFIREIEHFAKPLD